MPVALVLPTVIDSSVSTSVTPCVAPEALLRRAMLSAIKMDDADQAERLLRCAADVPVVVAIRALWLPLTEELGRADSACDRDGQLGHLLRQQIRSALLAESPLPVSRWLVPSTVADTTAAHLAALVLTRLGMGARVWPWPLPAPGPTLHVGDGAPSVSGNDQIPVLGETSAWPPLAALVA